MAKDTEDSKTVPIYDHNGKVLGFTTPEKAAGKKGERMEDVFGGSPTAQDPTKIGLDFGFPEGTEDDLGFIGEDGRATYNPGWSFGAGGDPDNESNMYWYGDGPRPSDTARDAWAKAHLANAGKGLVPGSEGNLGLGSPYTKPAPEIDDPYGVGGGGGGGGPGGPGGGGGGGQPPAYEEMDKWHGKNKQRDTSWNWDAFSPKGEGDSGWGGFDEDYGAFERYQPGQDSPWGMPDVEGGNKNFYQQQFANMLRDEQGFRSRQKASQKAANRAALSPKEAPSMDDVWDWANLEEGVWYDKTDTGGGSGVPSSQQWMQTRPWEKGATNESILRQFMDMPQFEKHADATSKYLESQKGGGDEWGSWNPNFGNPTRSYRGRLS